MTSPTPPTPDPARMTPESRLDLEVQVLHQGRWCPGWLEHRRARGDDWEGYVRYTTGPGETRLGWFDPAGLRLVTGAAGTS